MDLALLEVFLAFLFVFLMVGVPWADQIAEALFDRIRVGHRGSVGGDLEAEMAGARLGFHNHGRNLAQAFLSLRSGFY